MKVKISKTGQWADNQTYDVDSMDWAGTPNLEVSNNAGEMKLTFINPKENDRFHKGINMCRAVTQDGIEVYITGLAKQEEAKPTTQIFSGTVKEL